MRTKTRNSIASPRRSQSSLGGDGTAGVASLAASPRGCLGSRSCSSRLLCECNGPLRAGLGLATHRDPMILVASTMSFPPMAGRVRALARYHIGCAGRWRGSGLCNGYLFCDVSPEVVTREHRYKSIRMSSKLVCSVQRKVSPCRNLRWLTLSAGRETIPVSFVSYADPSGPSRSSSISPIARPAEVMDRTASFLWASPRETRKSTA